MTISTQFTATALVYSTAQQVAVLKPVLLMRVVVGTRWCRGAAATWGGSVQQLQSQTAVLMA